MAKENIKTICIRRIEHACSASGPVFDFVKRHYTSKKLGTCEYGKAIEDVESAGKEAIKKIEREGVAICPEPDDELVNWLTGFVYWCRKRREHAEKKQYAIVKPFGELDLDLIPDDRGSRQDTIMSIHEQQSFLATSYNECYDALGNKQKELVRLHLVDGMTQVNAAKSMSQCNENYSSEKKALTRAMISLKKCMAGKLKVTLRFAHLHHAAAHIRFNKVGTTNHAFHSGESFLHVFGNKVAKNGNSNNNLSAAYEAVHRYKCRRGFVFAEENVDVFLWFDDAAPEKRLAAGQLFSVLEKKSKRIVGKGKITRVIQKKLRMIND